MYVNDPLEVELRHLSGESSTNVKRSSSSTSQTCWQHHVVVSQSATTTTSIRTPSRAEQQVSSSARWITDCRRRRPLSLACSISKTTIFTVRWMGHLLFPKRSLWRRRSVTALRVWVSRRWRWREQAYHSSQSEAWLMKMITRCCHRRSVKPRWLRTSATWCR